MTMEPFPSRGEFDTHSPSSKLTIFRVRKVRGTFLLKLYRIVTGRRCGANDARVCHTEIPRPPPRASVDTDRSNGTHIRTAARAALSITHRGAGVPGAGRWTIPKAAKNDAHAF